jgi:outer membrane receptor protein involved in Fe transport
MPARYSVVCLIIAICLSPVLYAQQQDEVLEEIVVRGQKRDQALRDVNASVAVYDSETISELTFTDITGLYQFTPNVQATVADEGDFSIRGINFRGENLSLTSNVGSMYVDGIFQSTLGIEAGPSGIFDLEQVEIYRGVQSTIQGRNALAGAVHIRTADPTFEWEAKGRAEYAEYETQRYGLAFGGPIVSDQVAFRVSIDEYESDGFITNPSAGIDNLNFDDSHNRRLKLLVEPEALDGFSALFTYLETGGFAGTGFGTSVANGPDFFARESNPSVTDPSLLDIDTENWAVELRQDFSQRLSLTFVATNSDAEEETGPRFSSFDLDTFYDFATDAEVVDTYELRGNWAGDRFNLVGGLYYFKQERGRDRDLFFGPADFYFFEGVDQEIENTALFFDGEYDFTDRTSLLFGARLDNEEYTESGVTAQSIGAPIDPASLDPNLTDTDYGAFLPKVGIRWDQTEDLTWSFVIQRGYRPGGAAIDGSNTPYEFDPEYTINYELALRSRLMDGRLNVNANLFYTDWDDQQVTVELPSPGGALFRTANAGESRLSGVEIELSAALTEYLRLIAGLGLLDTEFEDFPDDSAGENFAGNRFSQAPSGSFNLALFYDRGEGFFGSVDARYQTDAYSDAANIEEHKIDSYFLMNARVGYQTGRFAAAVFARNLLDEDYLLRIRNVVNNPDDPLLWEANVGAPRVIGAEVTFRF